MKGNTPHGSHFERGKTNTRKSIRRRGFLKSVGLMAAAPLALPSPMALGSAVNDSIAMGAIGVGGQGTGIMRAFLEMSDVRMLAMCDVFTPNRERAQNIVNDQYDNHDCAGYRDFRELLDRDDIDAVTVGTPDHWHTLNNLYAVRSGKDVYSEKPLTLTIHEGRVLVDAVRRYGRVLQTGSQQRSDSNFRFACELVRSGRIGKVHTVRAFLPVGPTGDWTPDSPPSDHLDWDMYLGPAPWVPHNPRRVGGSFRWFFDYSGGQMTDWGAHHYDIAQWGLGMDDSGPISVQGTAQRPADGMYDTFVTFNVEFEYANGVKMIGTTPERGTRFEGEDGWVHVWRGGMDAEPKSLLNDTIGPGDVHLYRSPGHFRDFINCVRSRKRPICDVEIGHRSVTCAHLANIACKLGRKLRWDPENERFLGDDQANQMLHRPYRAPWRLV